MVHESEHEVTEDDLKTLPNKLLMKAGFKAVSEKWVEEFENSPEYRDKSSKIAMPLPVALWITAWNIIEDRKVVSKVKRGLSEGPYDDTVVDLFARTSYAKMMNLSEDSEQVMRWAQDTANKLDQAGIDLGIIPSPRKRGADWELS